MVVEEIPLMLGHAAQLKQVIGAFVRFQEIIAHIVIFSVCEILIQNIAYENIFLKCCMPYT
jgi:hypothetical protein